MLFVGWVGSFVIGGNEIAIGRLRAFVDGRKETCEWMAQAFVAAEDEASVLRQEVSAYEVQGLNDETMEVSGDEHWVID